MGRVVAWSFLVWRASHSVAQHVCTLEKSETLCSQRAHRGSRHLPKSSALLAFGPRYNHSQSRLVVPEPARNHRSSVNLSLLEPSCVSLAQPYTPISHALEMLSFTAAEQSPGFSNSPSAAVSRLGFAIQSPVHAVPKPPSTDLRDSLDDASRGLLDDGCEASQIAVAYALSQSPVRARLLTPCRGLAPAPWVGPLARL